MGKKAKTGKARKDKFYQLAKETGYRSRAAFKLLQLNRQHGFLEKSRVCLDLCAAPGGWLQVAQQNMPVSSLIIGVDLVPIKPIPNVVSLIGDITTEKCRANIRKELRDWKVDIVLHDGAPNVGQNWLHDAFQQAQLTLQAMKIAVTFLRKGGWFVTKLFRSKDYHAVLWVFNQLFKKVYATKPQASRNESAEIFVVCQVYLAPDKLDPKFTDPRYVFKDIQLETKSAMDRLLHPDKKTNRKPEGYTEGDYTLHHKIPVSKFLEDDDFLSVLVDSSELVFDDEDVEAHPLTTKEIKECCKDIKVLGKKDIRALIIWRKKICAWKESLLPKEESSGEGGEKEVDEEEEIEQQLARIKDEYAQKLKRKKKKVLAEKKKLRVRISMGMDQPGDTIEQVDDVDLFDVKKISSKSQLDYVEQSEPDIEEIMNSENPIEEDHQTGVRNLMYYDRFQNDETLSDGLYSSDEEEQQNEEFLTDGESPHQSEDDLNEDDQNPLIVDLKSKEEKVQHKMSAWFNKASFTAIEGDEDDDEDFEIGNADEKTARNKNSKGGSAKNAAPESSNDSGHSSEEESDNELSLNNEDDADSDDSEFGVYTKMKNAVKDVANSQENSNNNKVEGSDLKVVPVQKKGKETCQVKKLDSVGLAIASEMIKSKKRKREIEESSFNRYVFNDDGLPQWFVKDEQRHCHRQPPVSEEKIREFKDANRAIDVRPIKKIAEAKARKKKKVPTATLR